MYYALSIAYRMGRGPLKYTAQEDNGRLLCYYVCTYVVIEYIRMYRQFGVNTFFCEPKYQT